MKSTQEEFVWKLDFHEDQDRRDEVASLRGSLLRLINLNQDLASCLNLFSYCERKSKTRLKPHDFSSWKATAIRDGAIILEQYLQAMRFKVNGDNWQNQINRKQLSQARKSFDKYFPNISDIRQTIVHQSEMDREKFNEHAITTPQKFGLITINDLASLGGHLYLPSNYIENGYYASYRGRLVGYYLSSESAHALNGITSQLLQAFSAVDRKI